MDGSIYDEPGEFVHGERDPQVQSDALDIGASKCLGRSMSDGFGRAAQVCPMLAWPAVAETATGYSSGSSTQSRVRNIQNARPAKRPWRRKRFWIVVSLTVERPRRRAYLGRVHLKK